MAGKEFDKSRVATALEVVKQHPGMALWLVSPVLVGFVLLWWLVHPVAAVLALVAVSACGVLAVGRGSGPDRG